MSSPRPVLRSVRGELVGDGSGGRAEVVRSMLKARGVDAIISFRAMLLDLLEKIEVNQNYAKSDTLQVMRILKNYDLLKDPQMDLLAGAARRPTVK